MPALLLACLLLLLAAPSAGAAYETVVDVPDQAGTPVRAVALAADGRGALVRQRGGAPYSAATTTIERLGGATTTYASTAVLDTARRADGGVDLLVRRGDPERPGDLILRRVLTSGRVLDLWSVRTTSTRAALTRTVSTTVVAYAHGDGVRVVTRPDGGIPIAARTARLGARAHRLDVAVGATGRPVIALTTSRDALVLAEVTHRGRVVRRETRRGVGGLVHLAATPKGRLGLLVEDTGIEGDSGECASDGRGRHVRVSTRGPRSARFGRLQELPVDGSICGMSVTVLRALPDERLVAAYGTGSFLAEPSAAQVSIAFDGGPFSGVGTVATAARLTGAAVTGNGQLVLGLLRLQQEQAPGTLVARTLAGQESTLAEGVLGGHVDVDASGRAVVVAQGDGRLRVLVDR